jgi:CheY-like chemotaxis protein
MELKDATVLIVDDEVVLLGIFKGWFEREGCRVLTAENGAVALNLLTTNHVDVVLSDIRMPVLDGVGLAKRLEQTNNYQTKIIFISGYSDLDKRECYGLGVEAYVPKPVRRGDLISVVKRRLMDRDELWRMPPGAGSYQTLDAAFESFLDALERGLIAFGRGGFCVRSAFVAQVDEAIKLCLEFKADRRLLVGQGVVRWRVRQEEQIGIEITYIDEANRASVVGLLERNRTASFIPRNSYATTNINGSH